MKFRGLLAAAAATLIVAPNVSAQNFFVGNDAAFNVWSFENGFEKFFGLQARAGNSQTNGDWELGVTQPNDSPFAGAQGQVAWTPGPSDFTASFDGTSAASLSAGGATVSTSDLTGIDAPLNTLVLRAFRGEMRSMSVQLIDGSVTTLVDVISPSETISEVVNWVFRDDRLANGFFIMGTGLIDNTVNGSNSTYQFKVGNSSDGLSVVPEPGTFALLGLGLTGWALVARRRSNV